MLRGDTAFDAPEPPAVRLLPYFDAFAGRLAAARACCSRAGRRSGRWRAAQAGNFPVLLLDGVVGGVWHQKRSGRRVAITVEPLGRLTKRTARRRSTPRSSGSARSSTRPPELSIGPIAVGPHA